MSGWGGGGGGQGECEWRSEAFVKIPKKKNWEWVGWVGRGCSDWGGGGRVWGVRVDVDGE